MILIKSGIGDNGVGSVDHPLTVVAGSEVGRGGLMVGKPIMMRPRALIIHGIQVWERSSGERFSSSKFYLNGVEFAARQGGSDDFPDSNADYLEAGNGFEEELEKLLC